MLRSFGVYGEADCHKLIGKLFHARIALVLVKCGTKLQYNKKYYSYTLCDNSELVPVVVLQDGPLLVGGVGQLQQSHPLLACCITLCSNLRGKKYVILVPTECSKLICDQQMAQRCPRIRLVKAKRRTGQCCTRSDFTVSLLSRIKMVENT